MLVRLWDRNQAIFRTIASRILYDPATVEDVLQESFRRVLEQGKGLATEKETFNYIRKVVVNTSIDYYRRRCRDSYRVSERCEPVDPSADPLRRLIREEEASSRAEILNEVRLALEELPEEQRQAIGCFFGWDGRRKKDICRDLGIPYSTLRSRMLAGVDRIRERLRDRGFYQKTEDLKP